MRLINTSSLELEEFTEDKIPYGHYAVLSHRWTEDEITFKQYRKGLSTQSLGYQKVVQACNYARARKRPYIWVDTACIDKRSSAELSEAVNSMYRWYQRSAECYVYLQDVELPKACDEQRSMKSVLQDSEWFQRGWTLQEMLAPSEVIFLTAQ